MGRRRTTGPLDIGIRRQHASQLLNKTGLFSDRLSIKVLQQNCDFFDSRHGGIIFPTSTFRGFYKLGFGVWLSLLAVFIIHTNFSYPMLNSYLPDPFFPHICRRRPQVQAWK